MASSKAGGRVMAGAAPTNATTPAPSAGPETNALNLRWAFGFNSQIPGGVYSLVTPERNAIFYVAAHTGVILDTTTERQYLLQGHCNPITAVCVSQDKRWIATADSGKESMIVVWDALKASPVKILQNPFPAGVCAIDMSADAMFLVTLSHNFPHQRIAVWEWTVDTALPAVTAEVDSPEFHHCVRFNPVDVRDIVSNGFSKVVFWAWSEQRLTALHPVQGPLALHPSQGGLGADSAGPGSGSTSKGGAGAGAVHGSHSRRLGLLTQTMFVPYTTKAVTATSTGNVVLWDYPVSALIQSSGRDAVKVLKICNNTGINVIDSVLDRYLVCGCSDGAIRFFDFQFRIVAWFEDLFTGSIVSFSFADKRTLKAQHSGSDPSASSSTGKGAAGDPSTNGRPGGAIHEFAVPELVVATSQGKILRLDAHHMDALGEDRQRRGQVLVQGFDGAVLALDAHPSLPLLVVGTSAGSVQLWDMDERELLASRKYASQAAAATSISNADIVAAALTSPVVTSGVAAALSKVGIKSVADRSSAAKRAGAKGAAGESSSGASAGEDTPFAALHSSLHSTAGAEDGTSGGRSAASAAVITCIKFAPSGRFMAVGFANGAVELVTSLITGHDNAIAGAGGVSSTSSGAGAGSSTTVTAGVTGAGVGGSAGDSLHPIEPLQTIQRFQVGSGAVTHLTFSQDEIFLASADQEHCVTLYRFTHRDEAPEKPLEWTYVGRNQAHFAAITGLQLDRGAVDLTRTPQVVLQQFEAEADRLARLPSRQARLPTPGSRLGSRMGSRSGHGLRPSSSAGGVGGTGAGGAVGEDGSGGHALLSHATGVAVAVAPVMPPKPVPYRSAAPRLFSLGADRRIVEFDVARASIRSGLKVLSSTVIEQSASPTALLALSGQTLTVAEALRRSASGVGGTLPSKALLMESADPEDLIVETDCFLTCNDEYKVRILHSQTRRRPPYPAGAGAGAGSGAGAGVGGPASSPVATAAGGPAASLLSRGNSFVPASSPLSPNRLRSPMPLASARGSGPGVGGAGAGAAAGNVPLSARAGEFASPAVGAFSFEPVTPGGPGAGAVPLGSPLLSSAFSGAGFGGATGSAGAGATGAAGANASAAFWWEQLLSNTPPSNTVFGGPDGTASSATSSSSAPSTAGPLEGARRGTTDKSGTLASSSSVVSTAAGAAPAGVPLTTASAAASTSAPASTPGLSSAVAALIPTRGAEDVLKGTLQCAAPSVHEPVFCRKTVLSPTYGGPVTRLLQLPRRVGNKILPSDTLVYACQERVCGLLKLPLTGNPNHSMALLAHPGAISQVVASFDGCYLLTAGGADRTVNLWAVNTPALDASIALGGHDMAPFMGLLEGGADGQFFQDLLDLFYHAQLRAGGLHGTDARRITGRVPVHEAVNTMRALGFFPSEQEVRAIHHEVLWDHFVAGVGLGAGSTGPVSTSTGSAAADRAFAANSSGGDVSPGPNGAGTAGSTGGSSTGSGGSSGEAMFAGLPHADLPHVDLAEFVRLFVNHRPVFGLGMSHFEDAFRVLRGVLDQSRKRRAQAARAARAAARAAKTAGAALSALAAEEAAQASATGKPVAEEESGGGPGEGDDALDADDAGGDAEGVDPLSLSRDSLVQLLTEHGEALSKRELFLLLDTLVGAAKTPGAGTADTLAREPLAHAAPPKTKPHGLFGRPAGMTAGAGAAGKTGQGALGSASAAGGAVLRAPASERTTLAYEALVAASARSGTYFGPGARLYVPPAVRNAVQAARHGHGGAGAEEQTGFSSGGDAGVSSKGAGAGARAVGPGFLARRSGSSVLVDCSDAQVGSALETFLDPSVDPASFTQDVLGLASRAAASLAASQGYQGPLWTDSQRE